MVLIVSGYYKYPFKGFWGVHQIDKLYPKIFNIVVDTVVRH